MFGQLADTHNQCDIVELKVGGGPVPMDESFSSALFLPAAYRVLAKTILNISVRIILRVTSELPNLFGYSSSADVFGTGHLFFDVLNLSFVVADHCCGP